jgi:dolichyl-phosphate-mannose-protein mannosyltransferase
MKRSVVYPLLLSAMSLLTHFLFFGYPAQVVFDEVRFGQYVAAYLTHSYVFDIHPPFAKLVIAATGHLGGFVPSTSFAKIGLPYQDGGYLFLRLLPTLAGALLPLVLYFTVRELGCDYEIALLMGFMLAMENSLVVESRFILTDSILLLTGFLSLLFFLRYSNRNKWRDLFAAGTFGAFALATKWVGLSYLGIVILFFFAKWVFARPRTGKPLCVGALALLVVPAIIYVSLFAVHFSVLNQAGAGDDFQTPAFQKTLAGSPYANNPNVPALDFWQKFIELNRTMYAANQQVLVDSYASKWHQWPFMSKPVFYWVEATSSTLAAVLYFVGNPVVWLLGLIAVPFGVIAAMGLWLKSGFSQFVQSRLAIVVAGYLASLAPLTLISRILFLYHYSPALIFSLLMFALVLQEVEPKRKERLSVALAAATVVAFLIIAPFTYGNPVPRGYLHFFAPLLHDNW